MLSRCLQLCMAPSAVCLPAGWHTRCRRPACPSLHIDQQAPWTALHSEQHEQSSTGCCCPCAQLLLCVSSCCCCLRCIKGSEPHQTAPAASKQSSHANGLHTAQCVTPAAALYCVTAYSRASTELLTTPPRCSVLYLAAAAAAHAVCCRAICTCTSLLLLLLQPPKRITCYDQPRLQHVLVVI